MKCLVIQIETQRDQSHTVNELLELTRSKERFPEVDIDDDSNLVSLNYFTEDLAVLWQELQLNLFADGVLGSWLKKVAIVGCEGATGWDDALLLFHYNPNEKCDKI